MQQREYNPILVAAVLCVVCSLAVSAAAVALRPMQEANKRLDQQKNILDATGLALGEFGKPAKELSREQIDKLYGWISEELVDLETGEYTDEVNIETYDPREAAEKDDTSVAIEDPKFDPGVDRREKIAKVYFVRRRGKGPIQQVVLPVYGKGLWSTLYGYMALKSDLDTVQGLTFYQHGETPGLGGEVDNPAWKAQWVNLKLFDENGEPAAEVYKGPAPPSNPYAVDGLSGATITSRGVTNLVRYWASDDAYGPFLEKFEQQLIKDSADNQSADESPTTESPDAESEDSETAASEPEGE